MSTFVTAIRIGGPAERALARNASSGPDSSADASVTNTSASADGRNARVAAAWAAFRPPTPGVSTSAIPRPRNAFGRPTSTSSDPASMVAAVPLRDPAADLVRRDRLDDQLAALAPPDDRRRLVVVADDGDGDRREVVVHRTDRAAEQRVDEGALSLLELADDADDGVRAGDTGRDPLQATGQIVPTMGRGEVAAQAAMTPASDDGSDRRGRDGGRLLARRPGRVRHPAECTLRVSDRVAR